MVQRLIQINHVLTKLSLEQLDIASNWKNTWNGIFKMYVCIYIINNIFIYGLCTYNYMLENTFIYFLVCLYLYTNTLIYIYTHIHMSMCRIIIKPAIHRKCTAIIPLMGVIIV